MKSIEEEERRKREKMKFGYRAPIVEYNQSKIYENTEIKNNI